MLGSFTHSRYHISLVELLAACAEGKNVYTEIKCTSLLPLEDVVRVVTHTDCITEVLTPPLRLSAPPPREAALSSQPVSASGEDGLRQLCEPLLRGHGGGDEGDLHIQPHLEAL